MIQGLSQPGAGRLINRRVRKVLVFQPGQKIDPAMRGWMNGGKSYIRPVEINEVMRAGQGGVDLEHDEHVPGVADGQGGCGAVIQVGTADLGPDAGEEAGRNADLVARGDATSEGLDGVPCPEVLEMQAASGLTDLQPVHGHLDPGLFQQPGNDGRELFVLGQAPAFELDARRVLVVVAEGHGRKGKVESGRLER